MPALQDSCRMCGGSSNSGVSLVDPIHRNLVEAITANFRYIVMANNGFPTRMCDKCITNFNQWKTFLSQCKDSESKFCRAIEPIVEQSTSRMPHKFHDPVLSPSENVIAAKFPQLKIASVPVMRLEVNKTFPHSSVQSNKDGVVTQKRKCRLCDKKFHHIFQLKKHLEKIHHLSFEQTLKYEPKVFACKVCPRKFATKSALKLHFGSHSLPFACKFCAKRLTTQCNLKKHLLTHKERQFFCEHCKKKFSQLHHLKDHMETQHNNSVRKYKCDKCDMSFKCKPRMRKHQKYVHTNKVDFPWKCEECESCFKFKGYLTLHKKNVHVEAKFRCRFCSFIFKRKCHLTRHVKNQHNESEKHFKCDHCDMKFKFKSVLLRHVKNIHESANTQWKCSKCNKSFQFQFKLADEHMKRIHSNSIWLYCCYCRRKYVDKCDLKFHIKKLHLAKN